MEQKTEIKMQKLRVWHIPQVPMKSFNVPVSSVEEAKKVMDILALYDAFQFENRIKGDYANVNGLQMYNEETQEWEDWYLETENDCFEDVTDYVDSDFCTQKQELAEFTKELHEQVDWDKIDSMTN